jgi:hypothetical protein
MKREYCEVIECIDCFGELCPDCSSGCEFCDSVWCKTCGSGPVCGECLDIQDDIKKLKAQIEEEEGLLVRSKRSLIESEEYLIERQAKRQKLLK